MERGKSIDFSNRLKQAIDERNISQTELSELTGLGKSSISQYLSGENVPREKNIQKLADALDCSVAFLKGSTPCSESTDAPQGLRKVSVAEAARRIGSSQQYVRVGLQTQRLKIGSAVKMSTKWTYNISPKLLDAYISGNN